MVAADPDQDQSPLPQSRFQPGGAHEGLRLQEAVDDVELQFEGLEQALAVG